jgi:LAS superfamily LD-carboxypeptidase LdcB
MVELVAQHLKQRNYRDIRAATAGFPRPQSVGNGGGDYAPDVTVVNRNDSLQIFEVETADALEKGHGVKKWSALAHFASQHDGNFWLVVPKGGRKAAADRLAGLKLSAKIWEI